MRRYTIVPIVEGHGEVYAVPVILRRWFQFRRFLNFDMPDLAVRAHHGSLICAHDPDREQGIECYVARAAARPRDCKGRISPCIGRKYSPTADQKVLAEHIGFRAYMGRYSPSFGKLLRDLERIAHEARCATRDRSRSDRHHLDKGSQTQ